jgi:hypothetical protein
MYRISVLAQPASNREMARYVCFECLPSPIACVERFTGLAVTDLVSR